MKERRGRHIILLGLMMLWLVGCTAQHNSNFSDLGFIKFEVIPTSALDVEPQNPFQLTLTDKDGEYSGFWENINSFPGHESFYVGQYTATVSSGEVGSEGYDCQCFATEQSFVVEEGRQNLVKIESPLTQALVMTHVNDESTGCDIIAVTMHTRGFGYVPVDLQTSKPLFMQPGATEVIVTLRDVQGHEVSVCPQLSIQTENDHLYNISVTLDAENRLTIKCMTQEFSVLITPEVMTGSGPEIQALGFEPDKTLMLFEGYPASQPVIMEVTANSGIKSLMLTSQYMGKPYEVNLLENIQEYAQHGLIVTHDTDSHAKVDFTTLLENLVVNAKLNATFTLVAVDQLGRWSDPCTLQVTIEGVDFACLNQQPGVLGTNIATVTLLVNVPKFQEDDFSVLLYDETSGEYMPTPIIESEIAEEIRLIKLSFNIGEGINNPKARIDFMGIPKLLLELTRQVPEYSISVNAFATKAFISIEGADESMSKAITKYVQVKVDGKLSNVVRRETDICEIEIAGLAPATKYKVETVVINGEFITTSSFTTESDASIPDGDFEAAWPSVKYMHLPQGGIYSNTSFPLYTQQNFIDIDIWWPKKYWANVNDKTFCMEASNKNTWYMQPSAQYDYDTYASGAKSIHLTSVGWSLNGEDIPPYSQEVNQHLPYNANVPSVEHRSAGRLFLGSYAFDPSTLTETYNEGISFASRPTSLNGFYKFIPEATDVNDRGIVSLELIGMKNDLEVVIATAVKEFAPSTDLMAFNLPLDYHYDKIKAVRLKIMFSSSKNYGSIEIEDSKVKVSPNIPESAWRGSELWIDNLSFAY